MNYAKNTAILLLSAALSVPTLYAQDKNTATAKSSTLPIDLVADKGSYDQLAGIAVYEGNVKVTQGVSTIWADKLTIILKNNAAERIEGIGNPVKFKFVGDKQPVYGEAKQAVYQVVTKKVTLTGDAVVKQGTDVVKGSVLTYNLDSEIIEGSRVKMTFMPKN